MLSKLPKMANFSIDIRPQQNWTIKSFDELYCACTFTV